MASLITLLNFLQVFPYYFDPLLHADLTVTSKNVQSVYNYWLFWACHLYLIIDALSCDISVDLAVMGGMGAARHLSFLVNLAKNQNWEGERNVSNIKPKK
jgi:hypothetical protein